MRTGPTQSEAGWQGGPGRQLSGKASPGAVSLVQVQRRKLQLSVVAASGKGSALTSGFTRALKSASDFSRTLNIKHVSLRPEATTSKRVRMIPKPHFYLVAELRPKWVTRIARGSVLTCPWARSVAMSVIGVWCPASSSLSTMLGPLAGMSNTSTRPDHVPAARTSVPLMAS